MTQQKKSGSSRTSKTRRSGRSAPQKRKSGVHLSRHQWSIIFGIVLIALSGVAILSGLAISQGKVTDWMWEGIWNLFGFGGLAIPLVVGFAGLYMVLWGMEQPPQVRWERMVGFCIAFINLEAILHLVRIYNNQRSTPVDGTHFFVRGGGTLGMWIAEGVEVAVGRIGTWLLCLILATIGLVMMSGITFSQIFRALALAVRPPADESATTAAPSRRPSQPPVREKRPVKNQASRPGQPKGKPASTPDPVKEKSIEPAGEPSPGPQGETATDTGEPEKVDQPGLFYGDAVRMSAAHYSWQLPQIADILEPGTENASADTQIREQVEIIEHTLSSFGAPGRVVEINPGPAITQFGVEPLYIERRNGQRTKVKVGQISSLADDLALALAAQSIRIEAPVPGKGFIGIEVPNTEVNVVSLRDVMETKAFEKLKSQLKIGLGQDVSGHAVVSDLARMPHLLIAGATGSGKSVCVNGLVTCLLLNNTPDQLRLLMVDPKRVELTGYNGIPHLLTPVIVDLDKVVGTLQWVTREMDNRYRHFAEAGVRNIDEFNRDSEEQLPFIVVVIDELADLMMMSPEETERTICRLAQMARATGIHLVIATQRPSVDVVTGLIKANFPARIAFAVASSIDSRVILDSTGAERLLGRGDMLLMTPDAAQPQRLQGGYVSDKELRRLVEFWRKQRIDAVLAAKKAREGKPTSEPVQPKESASLPSLPIQQPLWDEMIEKEKLASEQDDLMEQAIEIVRESNSASVSMLQRRLRIGYTRAARLIDSMETLGIVGPHPGGSRRREVLLPPDQESSD